MKKNIIFILFSVLIMIGSTIYIAIRVNNNKLKEFVRDGYILSTENIKNTNKTTRYYFESGTKYKEKYQDKVSFDDIEGDKISLNNDSFIHYLDNSISTLKKGVLMDLDSITGSVAKYYNIFPKSMLEKRNDGYFINNLGKQMKFANFVLKTSDAKYLIISDKITLFLSETQAIDIKSYIELNFIEGNIIRLENQEVSYQTISSDSYIELANDMKIDLGTGNIYIGEEKKVSLNQMIIDSNDNVEITPPEDPKTETEDEKNGTDGQQGSQGSSGGVVGGNTDEEQIVDETKSTQAPVFTISGLEVTSNKLNATISITDDDNLLTSGTNLKIIENSTGKVVYMLPEDENGQFDIDVIVENLSPETNYTLIASATYTKNNIEYTKDFISKAIRTESLGIDIVKNYYTTSELSYLISIDEYSQVKAATVTLYDSRGVAINNIAVDAEIAKTGQTVTFSGLVHNSSYKVKLTDFHYDNTIIADGYEVEFIAKTLKMEPFLGQTNFRINKKDSIFTLSYDSVTDTDNGIVSYRYEVYDAREINDINPQPIKVIEKDYNSSIDINVDDIIIFRNEPYVFKVIVNFYDNEKYIEYESGYSAIMQLDGNVFPTVNLTDKQVTFERIKGTIEILDDGNTIDLSDDKRILIVYQNSLGDSKTITSSANLVIPLDINNLRANDTYIISVYATVDLSDNNEIIDNCLIGSVVVNTLATRPLIATMNAEEGDVSSLFTINAQLSSSTNPNAASPISSISSLDLEAKTLTKITFNLYEGIGESKTLLRSIPKTDEADEDPYVSTLKENYYDEPFVITPSFFGIANADLNDGFYTIEITQAYDYTSYKNDIPITNSIIEVKTNGVIPDIPSNPNNAITVTRILNKNADSRYKNYLDAETTVGYRVRANFDNAKKYAQYLKYYVHDAETDEIVQSATRTYNIDTTGTIDAIEFYLEDGTSFSTTDTVLRRGHRYYFSYEAYLDMNEDGNVDLKWPTNEIVLKSDSVTPIKQMPILQFYLSNSDSNYAVWKYTYSDVDNALVNKTISYEINDVVIGTVDITENNSFNSIRLNNLTEGLLNMFSSVALLKTEDDIQKQIFVTQDFEGIYQMPQLAFTTQVDVNRLRISLDNYNANLAYINRVAALKVTITNEDETLNQVIDNLILKDDLVYIDLIDIAQFMNQDFNVSVSAYYDTGIAGFESNGSLFALQHLDGEYYSINTRGNLTRSEIAKNSIFTSQFTINTLTINDTVNNRNKVLDLEILSSGIQYNSETINLKKLGTAPLANSSSELLSFDMIIPGVSLLDTNGDLNLASGLDQADVKIKLFGVGSSSFETPEIELRLFKSVDNIWVEENRIPISVNDLETANNEGRNIVISNLAPKTNYYFSLYANIYNGTTYVETQLYDVDSSSAETQYPFSTLSSVGISNIQAKYDYENSTYSNKKIKITYDLNKYSGYRMEYKLYKIIKNQNGSETRSLVDLNIQPDSGTLQATTTKTLPCNPGGSIDFGYDYEIELTSIATVTINSEPQDRILDDKVTQRFTLENLREPFIGVNSVPFVTDGNYKIRYNVNIFDTDKLIAGEIYKIKIFDSNFEDITPATYKDQEHNISDLNKEFIIENLGVDQTYILQVIVDTDLENSGTNFTTLKKSFNATTVNDYGINVGTIYAIPNASSRSSIDLNFYNSYNLNRVNEIRYSIYGQSGYSIDGRMDFTPQQKTYDQGYYYNVTLKNFINNQLSTVVLPSKGIYYIEIQFISEGIIVAQKSIEHNYTD